MSPCVYTLLPQAFTRLHKIGLCLSHTQTIRLLENLGIEFDSKVIQWKNIQLEIMNKDLVHLSCIRITHAINNFQSKDTQHNSLSLKSTLFEASHHNTSLGSTVSGFSTFSTEQITPNQSPATSPHSISSVTNETASSFDGKHAIVVTAMYTGRFICRESTSS